jgi:hypothetical protein
MKYNTRNLRVLRQLKSIKKQEYIIMRKLTRFICAWIAAPVVLFFLIPLFMLLDYLFEQSGAAKGLFYAWIEWAAFSEIR